MAEDYKDRLGNPIKEGFYIVKNSFLDIRFVTQTSAGSWMYQKIDGGGTVSIQDFKQYRIICHPEETEKLLTTLSRSINFIKSTLEQLAQPVQQTPTQGDDDNDRPYDPLHVENVPFLE